LLVALGLSLVVLALLLFGQNMTSQYDSVARSSAGREAAAG
jgi:hypothetical protein